MAKRTFHLNEEEKNAFRQREAASRDTSELKRLQAVRLYGSGWIDKYLPARLSQSVFI
jgi:hypothetical protein